jgi:hypothetical protein
MHVLIVRFLGLVGCSMLRLWPVSRIRSDGRPMNNIHAWSANIAVPASDAVALVLPRAGSATRGRPPLH